jgi:hypothetical protein
LPTTIFAAIALAMLGACEQKAPEPPAQKSATDDAAKKAAAAPAAAQPAAPAPSAAPPVAAAQPEAAPQPNPERNAYYGETHLHTNPGGLTGELTKVNFLFSGGVIS